MVEPVTPNIVPNTGELAGAWGTSAVNPNMSALDGLLGGALTLTLSGATTITLSASTASLTPSSGPFQSNNACLFLTGTQSGNDTIKFSQPGRYVVHNLIPQAQSAAGHYVKLAPASGGGTTVGAPPGQKVAVFYDGTNVDYIDAPPVGMVLGFAGVNVAGPAWWYACSQLPWLVCDGTVYNISAYPALGTLLGNEYGGDGVTTFGVPVCGGDITQPNVGLDSFIYIKT